jgi:hypothetical protein
MDYLQGKGVETIGLYAYPNLQKFYGDLGFKADEEVAVFQAKSVTPLPEEKLQKIGKNHFQATVKFDRECFGGDRKKLLKSIILEESNLAYYLSKSNEYVGYVASTVYETMAWVGPLMCQEVNGDGAVKLLKCVLGELPGKTAFAALPKKESTLIATLIKAGFKEDFSVVRMYFGPSVARNCIYLAESLERG